MDLAHYPDQSYDIAVLSQTLQTMSDVRAVLEQLVRIGRKAIVSVPNFGHWRNRVQQRAAECRLTKRSAMNGTTPDIHFCTITDFCDPGRGTPAFTIEERGGGYRRPARFTGHGFKADLFGRQGVPMSASGVSGCTGNRSAAAHPRSVHRLLVGHFRAVPSQFTGVGALIYRTQSPPPSRRQRRPLPFIAVRVVLRSQPLAQACHERLALAGRARGE